MQEGMNLDFFKDTLENGDEKAVRRALGHMISWQEIYGTQMHVEHGIEVNGDGVIYPATELYAKGVENVPGVTIHVRKATDWEPKHAYPVPELYRGQQVDILPAIPQEP